MNISDIMLSLSNPMELHLLSPSSPASSPTTNTVGVITMTFHKVEEEDVSSLRRQHTQKLMHTMHKIQNEDPVVSSPHKILRKNARPNAHISSHHLKSHSSEVPDSTSPLNMDTSPSPSSSSSNTHLKLLTIQHRRYSAPSNTHKLGDRKVQSSEVPTRAGVFNIHECECVRVWRGRQLTYLSK